MKARHWNCALMTAISLLPISAYGRSALQDSTDLKIKNASVDALGAENSIFIHPADSRIILEAHIYNSGIAGWVSQDGGKTWAGENSALGQNGDPAAVIRGAFGGSPRYFVQQIYAVDSTGSTPQRVVYKDSPTSLSWSSKIILDEGGQTDKGHLWADNDALSDWGGNLYAAWSNFDSLSVSGARSEDNGANWIKLQRIDKTPGKAEWGVNLKTGISAARRGNLYAVWGSTGDVPSDPIRRIFFRKSTDAGSSWSDTTLVAALTGGYGVRDGASPGGSMGRNSAPSMAVDSTGNIYVVWCEKNRGAGNDAEIYIAKSTNEGGTWSSPVQVCQDTGNHDQWNPWLTWDDCTNTLAVVFFDDRNSVNTYVAYSQDGDSTWAEFKVSDVGWSGNANVVGKAGDYIGIAARDGIAYPVWSDDRDVTYTFKPYVSPFYLWGVDQDSVTASIEGVPVDSITVTASWTTNISASSGDYIILRYVPDPPGTPYTLTSPVCTDCASGNGKSHDMSFTVPCEPGYWYYRVKSGRSGCSARTSNEKLLRKVTYCAE